MRTAILFTLFLLTVWLEATIVFVPLTVVLLATLAANSQEDKILYLALVSGLILDLLLVRPLGLASIFFVSIVFIIALYKRKIRSNNPFFVIVAVFLASLSYSFLFGSEALTGLNEAIILTFLVAAGLLWVSLNSE